MNTNYEHRTALTTQECLIDENYFLKRLIESYEELIELKNDFHAFRMDCRRNSTKEHIQKIKDKQLVIKQMKESLIDFDNKQEKN
tara:strand:- start:36 stop:290 length:255 start_codon:yes stop_codon:yes gene_type:complete